MREQITPSGILDGWLHRYLDELWLAFRIIFGAIVL